MECPTDDKTTSCKWGSCDNLGIQNKIPTEKDDQGKQSFKCDHPNFNSIHGSACDLIKINENKGNFKSMKIAPFEYGTKVCRKPSGFALLKTTHRDCKNLKGKSYNNNKVDSQKVDCYLNLCEDGQYPMDGFNKCKNKVASVFLDASKEDCKKMEGEYQPGRTDVPEGHDEAKSRCIVDVCRTGKNNINKQCVSQAANLGKTRIRTLKSICKPKLGGVVKSSRPDSQFVDCEVSVCNDKFEPTLEQKKQYELKKERISR